MSPPPRSTRRPPPFSWPAEKKRLREAGYRLVAGVDEVGVGALAGPVVAAVAILPLEARFSGLRDSKLLTPAQREEIYARALRRGIACAVGLAYAQEIDHLNIFHATRLAMCRAVARLSPTPDYLLMDGHLPPDFGLPCRAVVKGDALCPAISLASILAKVYRDRLMRHLALLFPHYGFEEHKGYGAPAHLRALEQYGPSPVHRRSFSPVARLEQLSLGLEESEEG
jgi:ribonuclease HII